MNLLNILIIKPLIFFLLFIYIINSFINKNLKKIKVCLCSIGKKENLYVKEFINHYKNLGYNHIFIYDNNDIKSERFSDVLVSEIKSGFVSIINYIGFRGKYNNSQIEAYYDCYRRNSRNYNWLSFYDFDEYLELKQKNLTIQEFLNDKKYKKCANVKINWIRYQSEEEALYYENKLLQIRFKKPLLNHISNKHIKSTVRGRLTKNYWSNSRNPHSSLVNYKSCSSSGKIVDSKTPFVEPPDYECAFIKHFYTKSFEEFCLKLKRGWPDITDNIILIKNLINENKNNNEKLKIIKKIFNFTN
jgi:hypothetical protein